MSDRTASRLTRILAMLPWVIDNPGVHVDAVCERFGYTRKELIKDLDLVFVCGLPGYGPGDLPVSEALCEEVLSLPIFPELGQERLTRVAEAVRAFYSNA